MGKLLSESWIDLHTEFPVDSSSPWQPTPIKLQTDGERFYLRICMLINLKQEEKTNSGGRSTCIPPDSWGGCDQRSVHPLSARRWGRPDVVVVVVDPATRIASACDWCYCCSASWPRVNRWTSYWCQLKILVLSGSPGTIFRGGGRTGLGRGEATNTFVVVSQNLNRPPPMNYFLWHRGGDMGVCVGRLWLERRRGKRRRRLYTDYTESILRWV
jgi:hypothetical protein